MCTFGKNVLVKFEKCFKVSILMYFLQVIKYFIYANNLMNLLVITLIT